jgi:hypothetical protein
MKVDDELATIERFLKQSTDITQRHMRDISE